MKRHPIQRYRLACALVVLLLGICVPRTHAQVQPTPTALPGGEIVYVVVAGDTLPVIADRFGIPLAELLARNNLPADAALKVGQRLLLGLTSDQPAPTLAAATATPDTALPPPPVDDRNGLPTPGRDGRILYTVQAGDTLIGIAARFGVALDALYTLNSLTSSSLLTVGQTLLLGIDQGAAVPIEDIIPPRYAGATLRENDGALLHSVRPQETLIEIALAYGYQTMDDFYAVSGLSAATVLTIDQQVVVGYLPQPQEVGGSTDLPTGTPAPTATAAPGPTATPRPTSTPLPFPSLQPTGTLPPAIDVTLPAATEALPGAQPTDTSRALLPLLGIGAGLLLFGGGVLLFLYRQSDG